MKKRKYKYNRGKYGSGYSTVQLSLLMGCHVATTKRWIKSMGIVPGGSDEELGNLIWLYREQKDLTGILRKLKPRLKS